MKYLAMVALVSLMNVAGATTVGEDQSTVTKDVTGTECMAPACIQQRKDKADAERKAKQQGAKSSNSIKK